MKGLKRKRRDEPANYDWLKDGMSEIFNMWRAYILLPTPKEQAHCFVLYRERMGDIRDELRKLHKCPIHNQVCH